MGSSPARHGRPRTSPTTSERNHKRNHLRFPPRQLSPRSARVEPPAPPDCTATKDQQCPHIGREYSQQPEARYPSKFWPTRCRARHSGRHRGCTWSWTRWGCGRPQPQSSSTGGRGRCGRESLVSGGFPGLSGQSRADDRRADGEPVGQNRDRGCWSRCSTPGTVRARGGRPIAATGRASRYPLPLHLWVMSWHAAVSRGLTRVGDVPHDLRPGTADVSALPLGTTTCHCGSVTNLVTRLTPTR